jgi:hypothetical protein
MHTSEQRNWGRVQGAKCSKAERSESSPDFNWLAGLVIEKEEHEQLDFKILNTHHVLYRRSFCSKRMGHD